MVKTEKMRSMSFSISEMLRFTGIGRNVKILSAMFLIFLTAGCYSQVIINEVQSSNSSTITDNFGEYEDWIEIYNPDDFEVDIGGLVLKDNVDVWQIPLNDTNTVLPPYGYFLLWADDQENQGNFHTNFKLSASNGEFLGLFESDSVTEIESVNIPPLSEDQSYGKCNGDWTILNTPTPLMVNSCIGSGTRITKNEGLFVYPTISKGDVNVELQNYPGGVVSLYLFSMDGSLVLNKYYNDSIFTIDLSHLTNDMYIISIFTEEDSYNDKIVLNK